MVEVMKIMVTSFKRAHARTATLSAPNTTAGHCRPMPLPETAGHSQAQSLVGSLLLSPESWCAQSFVGDGQGSLECCSSRGHKESDMTERLN